jgi:tetratricopeptide (TPR) repeat protein
MTFRILLSTLLSCCISISLFGQTTIHIRNGCHYDDDQLEQDIYAYAASDEAQQIIGQITAIMGLEQNFTIKAASIKNALATAEGRQRYILYSTVFLENFKRDNRLRWAAYGVLAHEIGHHLNNHDFDERDPKRRRAMEVKADFFSGNILQKLGATLEEAQACISTFSLDGESDTHPSKLVRLDAVANGWKQAKDGVKISTPQYVEPKSVVDNTALAKEWFDKGFKETDYNKKIEYYSKAIQLKPDYVDAYNNRGNAKGRLGNYKEAILDFDQSIKLKPNASAYYNRGVAKRKLNNYKDCILDYDQAISLKPDYAMAYVSRGKSKFLLGNYKDAILDFDHAIKLNQDDAEAYYNRANAKNSLQNYNEALKDIDKALQLSPNDAESHALKGCILVGLNKNLEALASIQKAIDLDKGFTTTTWVQSCKAAALAKLKD